ncbi:hypothetical protein [Kitasatospora sp. KL5]|uniref:hypothetical protein n=1 Tax=Kitasatospora sp. KL5 TaxID=3425125 RepID=UPI003D6EF02D
MADTLSEPANPELAREFLEQAYNNSPHVRLTGPVSGRPVISFVQACAGPVSSAEAELMSELSMQMDPGGLVAVDVFRGGTMDRTTGPAMAANGWRVLAEGGEVGAGCLRATTERRR